MNTHAFTSSLIAIGVLWAHPSLAAEQTEEESEDNEPTSKMNFTVAAPQAPAPREAFVHEGVYFRANVGPGMMHTGLLNKRTDQSDGSTAFSLSADLLAGGSPSPGIALGGGVLTSLAMSSKFGDRSGGGLLNFIGGPFFDAFPNPKGGFHLGALVGFSGLNLSSAISPSSFLVGGGASGWLGYDFWTAPEWSAGFNLRTTGAYMVGTDAAASVFALHALVTLLHH